MKSMKDAVMEHAMKDAPSSTYGGMALLELEPTLEHHAAGNLYIVALGIIREQQEKISQLEGSKNEN